MKNSSVIRLLYSDITENKKKLAGAAVIQIILLIIVSLVILSMQYGNLAKAERFIQQGENSFTSDNVFTLLILFSSIGAPGIVELDGIKEVSPKCMRFCIASPLSRYHYAAEKIIYNLITTAAAFVMNFFTTVILVHLMKDAALMDYLPLSMCLCGVYVIFIMTMNVLKMITRSNDIAGIILFAPMLTCVIVLKRFFDISSYVNTDIIGMLNIFAGKSVVLVMILLAAVFAASFAVYSWVYGRREK